MKTLTLLRHAKSSWDDPVSRDFDRPLNAKGKRAARVIGGWLRANRLRFDDVVASPATRVAETLDEAGNGYGRTLDARFDRRIYLASSEALLELVRETGDTTGHLLLAGHNPGLEELFLLLVPDDETDAIRGEVAEKFPTASVASLSFEVEGWRDIAPGRGRVIAFVRPRDLDAALGPED